MRRPRLAYLGLLLALGAILVGVAIASRGSDDSPSGASPEAEETRTIPRGPPITNAADLARAVTVEGMVAHLRALERIARDHRGHRAAGSAGARESVRYVAGRLSAAGYRVGRQRVRFPFFAERSLPRLERVSPSGPRYEAIRTLRYSGGGTVTARVQPVDLELPPPATPGSDSGCEADDFRGFTRGRVALVQRGTCTLRTKVLNAQRAGAAAIVIFNEGQPARTEVVPGTLGRPGARIPALFCDLATGRELAASDGAVVRVRVDAVSQTRTTQNVLAELEARSSGSASVVVGAHLDSVSEGPGVNDNGSGAAALLELAEELSAGSVKPARSVRIAFWGAEEVGLHGSRLYVDRLSRRERERVRLYLNLDMVGSHNGGRFIYRAEGGARGRGILDRLERVAGRRLATEGVPLERTSIGDSSDHASFAEAGIPAAGLYSGSFEQKTAPQVAAWRGRAGDPYDSCYHKRCDTLARIDRRALGQLADAAAAVIFDQARAPAAR